MIGRAPVSYWVKSYAKIFCIMTIMLFLQPKIAWSIQAYNADRQIAKLEAQCNKELSSDDLELRGAPSCKRLQKLREKEQQKLEGELSYHWNGGFQKYCYHDRAGTVVSCP